MLLQDRQLEFARDVIQHWLDLRGGELVPLDDNLDPRELLGSLGSLAIHRLGSGRVDFELASQAMKQRFGRDQIRGQNWLDLIPPTLRDAAERACTSICRIPCGYYHTFQVARGTGPLVTIETMVLPLRRRGATAPDGLIVFSHDDSNNNMPKPPAGWFASSQVQRYYGELVDIGAGIPVDRGVYRIPCQEGRE